MPNERHEFLGFWLNKSITNEGTPDWITTDVSAFYKTRLDTEKKGLKPCGGFYVFMKICGIKNKIDSG